MQIFRALLPLVIGLYCGISCAAIEDNKLKPFSVIPAPGVAVRASSLKEVAKEVPIGFYQLVWRGYEKDYNQTRYRPRYHKNQYSPPYELEDTQKRYIHFISEKASTAEMRSFLVGWISQAFTDPMLTNHVWFWQMLTVSRRDALSELVRINELFYENEKRLISEWFQAKGKFSTTVKKLAESCAESLAKDEIDKMKK